MKSWTSAAAAPLIALWIGLGALTAGHPAHAFQVDRERQSYAVSEFVLEYSLDHPKHVPPSEILDLEVGLLSTERGFVAPRPVDRTYRMKLSNPPPNARFFPSAIQHINWFIVLSYSRRGIDGVFVTVPDIEPGTGRDLRPDGETRLRLRVWTGRTAEIATVASGDRFGGLPWEARTNHPAHEWILALSPVQPGGDRDLLRIEELNDYAFQLSRHPGRRVDAELSPGTQPGTTRVTYRVAENRPWMAYAQYANTGSDATTKNRQSFGFTHNQLLGRDDILRFNYITGDFDEVHGLSASYEAPFTQRAPDWRGRIFGGASQFDATEVGFARAGFRGNQWAAGGQIAYTAFQKRELFLDLLGGVRWQTIEVENQALGTKGRSDFLLPRIGLEARRNTKTSALRAGLSVEANLGGLADTAVGIDLDILGRNDADEDFVVLQWDGAASFYLEPLLNRTAWRDPSTPESSTLAHEVALSFKGQWAFDYRLIPNFQQVAGGLASVRGYPQSATAGDTVAVVSAEYRFHLPRLLPVQPIPHATPPVSPRDPLTGLRGFRVAPPYVWGRPDWDLIFRVFVDSAIVHASDAFGFEPNETLVGAGGGVELQILRNLSIRFDAGFALSDLSDGSTRRGDSELYLVGTLLY